MSDDNGRKRMPNDKDYDPIFTAFQNLNLYTNNYNYLEPRKSSISNIYGNNNHQVHHPNVNVYNVGHMTAGSFNALPFTPPYMTQPGASSSTNSGQPLPSPSPLSFQSPVIDNDHKLLSRLLDMMTCEERYSDFLKYIQNLETYPTAKRESDLSTIGSLLTTNNCAFLDLATNQWGSQALRILFRRSPSLDNAIFYAVSINFLTLMKNKYGHELIIPAIRAVDKSRKELLYNLTYDHTLELAKLETGCIALNKVFQEIRGKFRDLIFKCVAQNSQWLSFDPYGTHVVQNFLTLHNPDATTEIAERLRGNFFRLAMERQGSYVVEKCLKSEFGRQKVLEEFRGNDKEWVRMATDKFGNFVAQCALREMKNKEMTTMLTEFLDKLRPHFWKMNMGPGKNTLRVIHEELGMNELVPR